MVRDSFISMMNIGVRQVMGMKMRNGLAHASVRKKQDAEHQQGEALPHPGCVTSEAESNNFRMSTSLVLQPRSCDTLGGCRDARQVGCGVDRHPGFLSFGVAIDELS